MSINIAPPPQPPVATNGHARADVPYTAPPPKRTSGGITGGLILIALGAVFLAGNVLNTSGAWLFVGLGIAFLIARIMTGQYGFAVPAGVLLGFGAFVGLTESRTIFGDQAGGLFFVCLGLGFVAAYIIGGRPAAVWPFFPAAALVAFGLLMQGWLLGLAVDQWWWLSQYWPLALVLVGAWLLVRPWIPPAARAPLAILGVTVLVVFGLLVAASGVARVGAPVARMMGPPLQDTQVLTAPLQGALQVNNVSGRTTLRASTGSEVRVEAVRRYWTDAAAPVVSLSPTPGGLTLQATMPPGSGSVDYTIDVPASASAAVQSVSGEVEIVGLSGAVTAQTVSGSIDVRDISGDLRATSTSGGIFIRFPPGASAQINATTMSGGIRTNGLPATPQRPDARTFSTTLGSGSSHVEVRTTSGGIMLASGS
jgi:hypothetical protein